MCNIVVVIIINRIDYHIELKHIILIILHTPRTTSSAIPYSSPSSSKHHNLSTDTHSRNCTILFQHHTLEQILVPSSKIISVQRSSQCRYRWVYAYEYSLLFLSYIIGCLSHHIPLSFCHSIYNDFIVLPSYTNQWSLLIKLDPIPIQSQSTQTIYLTKLWWIGGLINNTQGTRPSANCMVTDAEDMICGQRVNHDEIPAIIVVAMIQLK
jgi:hypothetical protein